MTGMSDTPIGATVVAFVVQKREIGLLGDAIFVGYTYPPRNIAEGTPFFGAAQPSKQIPYVGAPFLPTLQLTDTGEYLWGCECWWLPKGRADNLMATISKGLQLPIVPLTVTVLRTVPHE